MWGEEHPILTALAGDQPALAHPWLGSGEELCERGLGTIPPSSAHHSQQHLPLHGNPRSHSERHHVRRWPDPDESPASWTDAAAKYGMLDQPCHSPLSGLGSGITPVMGLLSEGRG